MPPELSRWLRNSAAAHCAILAGLWALFFWRYFAAPPNQVVFPDGDFTQQFFVFRSLAFRELAAGRLPLWTDCFFGGYPFHADPQAQLFYPPVWLSFGLLEETNVPATLDLVDLCGPKFDMMHTSFFLSRQTLIASKIPGMAIWREKVFAWMLRNAANAMEFFKLPSNRVVELGSQVEI